MRLDWLLGRKHSSAPADPAGQLLNELRAAIAGAHTVDHEKTAAWSAGIDRLFESSDLEAAEEAVRYLLHLAPTSSYARSMCAMFDQLPPADGTQTAFTDDSTLDVQVVPRPESDLVIALFCGRAHRLGMPLSVLHRWLGRLPASLIYLRDFRKDQYVQGVQSLGPDLETTVTELRRIVGALGGRRIACYGNSGGVFPAFLYGHALGAGTILAVSGKTNLTPEFNAFTPSEPRCLELAARYPHLAFDARRLFEKADRLPRICVVYGQEHWSDRRHAEHMATLPGVALWPVEGYAEHVASLEVIKRGEYPRLLDWLVSVDEAL